MPIIDSINAEKEAVLQVVKFMLASVRTAPKAGGIDDVLVVAVFGLEKDALAVEMEKIAGERGIEGFRRDAKNVRDSDAVLLVGVRGKHFFGVNCGACGYKSCEEFEEAEEKLGQDFVGPNCAFKLLDLGIALGSAAKLASIFNIDNRIMYRVGVAAKRLDMLQNATIIMGIPVSVKGKNIFFDRSK
jgi:uncharacterized ferredoxin-like protein